MTPLLVYGLDEENAWIAGPSSQPLVIPAATLAAARGRVKKERFRVTTLGAPGLQPPGERGRGRPAAVPFTVHGRTAARQCKQLRPAGAGALGAVADQHAQQAVLGALLRAGPRPDDGPGRQPHPARRLRLHRALGLRRHGARRLCGLPRRGRHDPRQARAARRSARPCAAVTHSGANWRGMLLPDEVPALAENASTVAAAFRAAG